MKNVFMNILSDNAGREEGWKRKLLSQIVVDGINLQNTLNDANDSGIKAMDNLATKITTLREKMKTASNTTLDNNAVSGNSNYQFYPTESNIYSISDISFGNNKFMISSGLSESHQIYAVDIQTNGQLGNSVDFVEKRYYDKSSVTTSSHVEIESFNTSLSATILIDFKAQKIVNCIEFNTKDFGTNPLSVAYVEVSQDGVGFSRADVSVEPNSDKTIVIFKDSNVRKIRLSVYQPDGYISAHGRKRFAIGIYNLKAGIRTSKETGQIILGPFNSQREVLKAAISASIPNDGYSLDNIKFEISEDRSTWREITIPYSISSKKKIINYNNYSTDSIKTTMPVKTLYLRITMTGYKVNKTFAFNSIHNSHTQTISISTPYINVPFELGTEHIVGKTTGVVFGSTALFNSYSDNQSDIDISESVMSTGEYKIKTIKPFGTIQSARIRYGLGKCVVEKSDTFKIITPRGTDASSTKFFKVSSPVKKSIRVEGSSNVVIPFAQEAGIYTLTDGTISRKIDLSSRFFTSAYQWAYQKHTKETRLISPYGKTVHVFKENTDINLLDYFTIEEPVFSSSSNEEIVFNRDFPLKDLSYNEFSIVNGEIKSSAIHAIVDAHIVVKTEIKAESKFGVGSLIFETDNVSLAKEKESLEKFDGKTYAKLGNTGILRGSIKFDFSKSSLASFINEVDFINGIDEFSSGRSVEILIPMNVNSFSLGRKVDKFAEIQFIGGADRFTNRVYSDKELISIGDYMLVDVSETETKVVLPNGIKTHDIIATSIILNISDESSRNGSFSVDYINGIIYSQFKIDGNTSVEYSFSNVYLSGKDITYIDESEYSIEDNKITFSSPEDNMSVVVISKKSENYNLDIRISPNLSNLILNTAVV